MVKAQGRLACSSGLQGRQASEEWGQAALGVAHWRARWGDRCRVGVGQGYRHSSHRHRRVACLDAFQATKLKKNLARFFEKNQTNLFGFNNVVVVFFYFLATL